MHTRPFNLRMERISIRAAQLSPCRRWQTSCMSASSTQISRITGIALIVLPLVALGLKMLSFGWMMLFVIFGPIFVMAIAYVLQIFIAAQGFFSKKDLFGPARKRATIAAWTSLIGFLVLGLTMPDGGDGVWGSTLQVWLGAYGENGDAVHAATDGLTTVLAYVSGVAWVVGWLWLAVEWVGAHAQRRKRQLGMI